LAARRPDSHGRRVDPLHRALFRTRLSEFAQVALVATTPEEFAALIAQELVKWQKVIISSMVKLDQDTLMNEIAKGG